MEQMPPPFFFAPITETDTISCADVRFSDLAPLYVSDKKERNLHNEDRTMRGMQQPSHRLWVRP